MRAASLVLQDDVTAALAAALSALRLHARSPAAHVARSVCRYVYWHLGDMTQLEAPTSGETGEYPDRLRAATAVFDCSVDAMTELRQLHLNSARHWPSMPSTWRNTSVTYRRQSMCCRRA